MWNRSIQCAYFIYRFLQNFLGNCIYFNYCTSQCRRIMVKSINNHIILQHKMALLQVVIAIWYATLLKYLNICVYFPCINTLFEICDEPVLEIQEYITTLHIVLLWACIGMSTWLYQCIVYCGILWVLQWQTLLASQCLTQILGSSLNYCILQMVLRKIIDHICLLIKQHTPNSSLYRAMYHCIVIHQILLRLCTQH